ncbi:MAG: Glyceraldehyde-3-phosphate dehydrogenase 1 [Alphaproteobacteria bacterium MarineAlpha2_Bin1]|nr:MAG: Glyceraldehyde-3-phosphate dehydrogenase 1 [Alphaproteobacteria bacterium MarineAlpha2_Bin1]|tara:strand:+ start:575 stop:1579 length:1005 start_codon:yes stop_codon:yes gene_type:complete
MVTRIAINGFGRIGRLVLRAIQESNRKDLKVIAINDLGSAESNAHLFRYDSNHGKFKDEIKVSQNSFIIGSNQIKVFSERDPKNLPWKKLRIDILLECTGIFTKRVDAIKHISAGAKKVLISAPASDEDLTVVYGVNHKKIKKNMKVISNASCTTNCLAPVAQVLNNSIGINYGYMTTIHAYTGDQNIQDTLHSDLRRARGAAQSMIPTSTGAAKAVGLVLPELKGKLDGTAIRVPTANVSLIDFKFLAKRNTSIDEIHHAINKASKSSLKGILEVSDKPLVSCDFNHTAASSTFDLTQTQVMGKRLCRVLSWYDNEWGFSNRMLDTATMMGKL